jgi:hypothetical protein
VQVPAQELARFVVPPEPGRRRVGERAAALDLNLINPLGCRVQQQPYVFFTLAQGFLGCHSFHNLPVAFDSLGDAAGWTRPRAASTALKNRLWFQRLGDPSGNSVRAGERRRPAPGAASCKYAFLQR